MTTLKQLRAAAEKVRPPFPWVDDDEFQLNVEAAAWLGAVHPERIIALLDAYEQAIGALPGTDYPGSPGKAACADPNCEACAAINEALATYEKLRGKE